MKAFVAALQALCLFSIAAQIACIWCAVHYLSTMQIEIDIACQHVLGATTGISIGFLLWLGLCWVEIKLNGGKLLDNH